ncbi:hypothetical protein GCM10010336_61220 [Streptomyces goshikiensis]|nr:hypothetical protein GCM10010336_61220 [Streptomyces goshikiensis]
MSVWAGTTGPSLYDGQLPFELQDTLGQAAAALTPLAVIATEMTSPAPSRTRDPTAAPTAPPCMRTAPAEGTGRRR